MTQFNPSSTSMEVNAAVAVSPFDRIRWGPILAGLFAALATLVLLTVLGMAIGLSAYDPGDTGQGFAWGSAIWAGISLIVSFFIGGCLAAYGATTRGERNGMLHGALVWAVAIPLSVWLLSGAVGTLMNTASNAAGNPQLSQYVQRPIYGSVNAPSADPNVQMSPEERQRAMQYARRTAWTTLVSLLLGLGAAAVGGLVGSRDRYDRERREGIGRIDTGRSETQRDRDRGEPS